MIDENLNEFFGLPVVDFASDEDWQGPQNAYRVRSSWDDPTDAIVTSLQALARVQGGEELRALVIGSWTGDDLSLIHI